MRNNPFTTLLLLLAAALLLGGCAGYREFASGYDRSYSISYGDAEGRDVKAGVTLHPLQHMPK